MAPKSKTRPFYTAGREPPRKRARLDENSRPKTNTVSLKPAQPTNYLTVDDLQTALGVQHSDALAKALTTIRNQLTLKQSEIPISPADSRLTLVQQWMGRAPGASDIFKLWETTDSKQSALISLFVSVLSSIVNLLSCNYTYHELGTPIIKTLLSPQWTRKINSYIGGPHIDLLLSTLKLLNSVTNFASGRERKSVLELFPWEMKNLQRLLNMRRKGKASEGIDVLDKPDIRTLYIFFLTSFIDSDASTQVKSTFLEQHRDAFLAVFKGLNQDPYPVVRKFLELCWSGLWSDLKVKRTMKIGLFNEITIGHLMKLYDRADAEDEDPEHVPADLVHHFLLAICTRPGQGICFKDQGWYPPDIDGERTRDDPDHEETRNRPRGGRIYNKILANVLKTLKANEDPRQQELTLKILTACPELVAGFWSGAGLTLEPRLSSRWIANVSLLGTIISLPVPKNSFLLPTHSDALTRSSSTNVMYQPIPPPLPAIIENILPSVNTKNHFSKGLQSNNGLVMHCTALALSKCLLKYQHVRQLFREIAESLQETEQDGQWRKRLKDLEREVRRRVPDFQVVLAFLHHAEEGAKNALLGESAHRLLWLYHSCLPEMVAGTKFDVGKLLSSVETANDGARMREGNSESWLPSDKLHDVKQLHILKLLGASDQFSWSAKSNSSKHTNLYVLLKALALCNIPSVAQVLASLLERMLSNSILFQEDPEESGIWLSCLPQIQRPSNASMSPDGAALTDEIESVVVFLDDCIQRCSKSPYRYIDELHAMFDNSISDSTNTPLPHPTLSPLLMTTLEQLTIKVTNKLLSPSDVLALSTFMRKLVFRLSSQTEDLQFLRTYTSKVDEALGIERLFPEYPVLSNGIRREVGILLHSLKYEVSFSHPSMDARDESIQEFPLGAEVPLMPSNALKAYELVDRVRLVEKPLRVEDVCRLTDLVSRLHPQALSELFQQLYPFRRLLWGGVEMSSVESKSIVPSFEILLLSSNNEDLVEPTRQNIFIISALTRSPNIAHLRRAVRAITHALVTSEESQVVEALLYLVRAILEQSYALLSPSDCATLKDFIFNQSSVLKSLFEGQCSNIGVHDVLRRIMNISLDPRDENDRRLASELSIHWIYAIKTSVFDGTEISNYAATWIKYGSSNDVFTLLDVFCDSDCHNPALLESILEALQVLKSLSKLDLDLQERLSQFLSLSNRYSNLDIIGDFVEMAISSGLPVGHDGLLIHDGMFSQVGVRWERRLNRSLSAEVNPFSYLNSASWSSSTARILRHAIYTYDVTVSDQVISPWLRSKMYQDHPTEELAQVLYAYLDCKHSNNINIPGNEGEFWFAQVPTLVKASASVALSEDVRGICGACVHLLVMLMPTKRIDLIEKIVEEVKDLSTSSLSKELLRTGYRCSAAHVSGTSDLLDAVVNHSLQWTVRRLAAGAHFDLEDQQTLHALICLLETVSTVKSHLAEPVFVVAIQQQLHNSLVLRLLSILLPKANLKPLVVNRYLQGIIQNPQFYRLCSYGEPGNVRAAIIDVLHVLFHLYPTNTCQPSHIEPLVPIYRGTVSLPDRKILSIFLLFEVQRKTSVASLLSQWSATPGTASSSVLEALQSIDSISVLRTCLHFPQWRTFEDEYSSDQESVRSREENLYDPVFLILLFTHVLAEDPPKTTFAWVELFRTNVVSLLLRSLSAKDEQIRELAASQIALLWKLSENADLQEKPHIFLILGLLRDAVLPSHGEVPVRLPSYTTLLLAHALRGVFYPSNFIYPLTARFLLQRPRLDVNDVPMLYNMLFSSGDHWRKDRGWIIRFLADGMQSTADWKVFKRRHTWDLLASLFQSSENDSTLRKGILEILANLTCIPQATTSLLLKSNLLTWIEMQLLDPKDEECIAWMRILENIMVIGNREKLEKVTDGEWRACIGRCIFSLLDRCKSMSTLSMLHLASGVLLRLSLLPGKPILDIDRLMTRVVQMIPDPELDDLASKSSQVRLELDNKTTTTANSSPPHGAFGLHEKEVVNPERSWGETIERLWRVSMISERKSMAWDYLTARLLVWRAVVGQDHSPIGEWARRQAVHALLNPT
ncbi:hypothetical protein K435DRAFT_717738 [Dendrothele bispora CBS 962.96]|uniref:Nucleolar pre-ribosomal-associated protein 1 C-terminal domain-containing protein n=1 Tax=Dendrothele bispora (strain CBS 962.96) TaxID=1314807 RepID=A0A4S8MH23_DENBC|nr:hypothetical protein K435DRAFT_717738 [Dendrothele bispora CBS 962.96]